VKTISGLMSRGKTAVLAVVVALVLVGAPAALAANGKPLILGKANNAATKVTALVGKVATGEALAVRNPSGGGALSLSVGDPTTNPATKTVAPMKVDSQAKVANLNADQLDGQDASAFSQSGHNHDDRYSPRLFAAIRGTNATPIRSSNLTATFKFGGQAGSYEIVFDRDISSCVYTATLINETAGRGNQAPNGEIGVRPLSTSSQGVSVTTYNSAGTREDRDFSIVVHC
jgi:hypothetical protein